MRIAGSLVLVAWLSGCGGTVERDEVSGGEVSGSESDSSASGGAGVAMVDFYRDHLGKQWGWHCDFDPSCSSYGREAVSEYGMLPGSLMIADRLMRDHPYSRGRYPKTWDGRPIDRVASNALFATHKMAVSAEAPPASEGALEIVQGEDQLFRFAETLCAERDWDRARIEYRRLLHLFPRSSEADRCRRRIVQCLAELGRYGEALNAAEALQSPEDRGLMSALVHRYAERWDDATKYSEGTNVEARVLGGFLAWEAGESDRARARFSDLPLEMRGTLLEHCDEFDALPRRSEVFGGLMSAVIPGSGQMYSGRYADGLVALGINAILIGGTVVAAVNEEEVAAAAIGTVALGFYAGNIYGGVNAASRFNREERDRFLTGVKGRVRQRSGDLGLTLLPGGGALSIYIDF